MRSDRGLELHREISRELSRPSWYQKRRRADAKEDRMGKNKMREEKSCRPWFLLLNHFVCSQFVRPGNGHSKPTTALNEQNLRRQGCRKIQQLRIILARKVPLNPNCTQLFYLNRPDLAKLSNRRQPLQGIENLRGGLGFIQDVEVNAGNALIEEFTDLLLGKLHSDLKLPFRLVFLG